MTAITALIDPILTNVCATKLTNKKNGVVTFFVIERNRETSNEFSTVVRVL